GVCEPALEPRGEREGSRTRCQGFKPDLGNSAVRHYRGAFENVAMVEMRTQLANRKSGPGNPPPTAGASELYPNHDRLGYTLTVSMQIDLHGHHPREIVWNGALLAVVEQAWEMG